MLGFLAQEGGLESAVTPGLILSPLFCRLPASPTPKNAYHWLVVEQLSLNPPYSPGVMILLYGEPQALLVLKSSGLALHAYWIAL